MEMCSFLFHMEDIEKENIQKNENNQRCPCADFTSIKNSFSQPGAMLFDLEKASNTSWKHTQLIRCMISVKEEPSPPS